MQILGINYPCQWVQITSDGRRYTCPTKEINGELCFKFKNEWHKVANYTTAHTSEFRG